MAGAWTVIPSRFMNAYGALFVTNAVAGQDVSDTALCWLATASIETFPDGAADPTTQRSVVEAM